MASTKVEVVFFISLIVMLALVQVSKAHIVMKEDEDVCMENCWSKCEREKTPYKCDHLVCAKKCYCSHSGFQDSKAHIGVKEQSPVSCYLHCVKPCAQGDVVPKKCRNPCIKKCVCSTLALG